MNSFYRFITFETEGIEACEVKYKKFSDMKLALEKVHPRIKFITIQLYAKIKKIIHIDEFRSIIESEVQIISSYRMKRKNDGWIHWCDEEI